MRNEIDTPTGRMKTIGPPLRRSPWPTNRLQQIAIRQLHGGELVPTAYFVNVGLDGVGGVGAAGEIWNVSQTFQPAGRFALANSP